MADTLKLIHLADIEPAADNLRIDLTDIQSLADSIAFIGLMEPIRLTKGDKKSWKVVAGHRRLAALKLNKVKSEKCIVQSGAISDENRTAAFLIENMQRVDLDIIEQTEGVRRLIQDYAMTIADVAKNLGVTKQWVKERIAILDVPKHCFDEPQFGNKLPTKHLALLGNLPDDVRGRLTKDDKIPSQYDIEDRTSKVKSIERGERDLKQLVKSSHLAVTEAQFKVILKTPLDELSGTDQMVKLQMGNGTATHDNAWDRPTEDSIMLTRTVRNDITKASVNDVLVLRKKGGFAEWAVAELVPFGGTKQDAADDEIDAIDKRNDERRVEGQLARRLAEVAFVEGAKPAELISIILWDNVMACESGYNSLSRCYRTCERLGLDPVDNTDREVEQTVRSEQHIENLNKLMAYAKKNGANLARAAATVAIVTDSGHSFLVDYPDPIVLEDYPESLVDDAPFEEGVA